MKGYIYNVTYSKWGNGGIGMDVEDTFCETLDECLLDEFVGGECSNPGKPFSQFDYVNQYESMEYQRRSLFIRRADGLDFNEDESNYIKKILNL
jgi:hypothetical protein